MLKGPPKNRPRVLPNPQKSELEASKIEPGGLQDGIFCRRRSLMYSCGSSKSVQGVSDGFRNTKCAVGVRAGAPLASLRQLFGRARSLENDSEACPKRLG